jgi:hypothetical protein
MRIRLFGCGSVSGIELFTLCKNTETDSAQMSVLYPKLFMRMTASPDAERKRECPDEID